MMMVPAVAILIGYLINAFTAKSARVIAGVAAVSAVAVFMFTFPITLKDGTEGLSARKPDKNVVYIETDFRESYDYGLVAFDDFGKSASPIDLGIPMDRMIYVGNRPYWDNLLVEPNSVARFIIMQPNDGLWKAFHNNTQFNDNYTLLATRNNTYLYKCTSNCTTKYR